MDATHETLTFRRACREDIPAMLEIVSEARSFLRAQGVNQWQGPYPGLAILEEDLTRGVSYVCCDKDSLLGMASLIFGREPTYDVIYEGAWLGEGPYGTVHRVAVAAKARGRGAAACLMRGVEALCAAHGAESLRVDTHRGNLPMQKMLTRQGYQYRGVIYLEDGSERLAFDKRVEG